MLIDKLELFLGDARFSSKIFLQQFPARFSHNNFPQQFPPTISRKIFLSWILIGWAPHHPIPNAKFPPITAQLNRPKILQENPVGNLVGNFVEKSCRKFCGKFLWEILVGKFLWEMKQGKCGGCCMGGVM